MEDSIMTDGEAADAHHTDQEISIELEQELDEKYPHRPRNHSKTLPFHDLFLNLFNPLNENKKKSTGPVTARKKTGPHGPSNQNPHEIRRNIVERFISRWRKEVGNDIYPAFRLIIPEKDRDRAMYGLKEKTIGKLLIKVMKINKDSEDGYNLLNWKQPGQNITSKMAGDFAGRCFEVISKRPMLTQVGSMTIGEVNTLLDKLSVAQKEEDQQPIFEQFYVNMNAEEMMWLIRMILRQMKVGATEKTLFSIWHPDAESLFNISSNLRRVCWELYDPSIRLEGDDRGITLMQCFQPQLAQFQMNSFDKMIQRMRPAEDDAVFWIEEKLDGERMQLHMVSDNNVPGGKKLGFWSRKAKDYSYLYGNGFMDGNSALTRHIKDAFHEGVENIILDGEMITWDPKEDAMVPFGTLKTAALAEQKNPHSDGPRPLYRVFDLLYLNGKDLTNWTLRDRRRALEASVKSIHRRMEVHTYKEAKTAADIERLLRQVVLEASEGLVLKNPRSSYRLNDRNDDWMKVKPEYMTEYGESLDCLVIGGYYGSGHRGGRLSSFLCGLRVDENQVQQGANPMKFFSFFKVGGGLTAADYAEVRHRTDGKWKKWDRRYPPTEYIELAGGDLQYEQPDEWIRPDESVVLEVKAASVSVTDQFKLGMTLRFPRFKNFRTDRDWKNALSVSEFLALQKSVETEHKGKQFQVDDHRKRRKKAATRKKSQTVAGNEGPLTTPYGGPATNVFDGLHFYIMSECLKPKKTKSELEQMVKSNGGKIYQIEHAAPNTFCIADRGLVKVASLKKRGKSDIVRPSWIFDNIMQDENDRDKPRLLLPLEPRHMFFTNKKSKRAIQDSIDVYGDSFARDISLDELSELLKEMPSKHEHTLNPRKFRKELTEHGHDLGELPGWMFEGVLLYADYQTFYESIGVTHVAEPLDLNESNLRMKQAVDTARFAGAEVTSDLADEGITHVLVRSDKSRVKTLTAKTHRRKRLPRLVTVEWIENSWTEGTFLDEERKMLQTNKSSGKQFVNDDLQGLRPHEGNL